MKKSQNNYAIFELCEQIFFQTGQNQRKALGGAKPMLWGPLRCDGRKPRWWATPRGTAPAGRSTKGCPPPPPPEDSRKKTGGGVVWMPPSIVKGGGAPAHLSPPPNQKVEWPDWPILSLERRAKHFRAVFQNNPVDPSWDQRSLFLSWSIEKSLKKHWKFEVGSQKALNEPDQKISLDAPQNCHPGFYLLQLELKIIFIYLYM